MHPLLLAIEIPGIIFWGVLVLITWIWIINSQRVRDMEIGGILPYCILVVLTIMYFIYAAYWVYSHWNTIPAFHSPIKLT